MKSNKITTLSRITLFICALGLLVVLFVPIWRIDLMAPQYPEGLRLLIYANKLAGNVDIINGLNHYIGMKTLHADDFAEFTVLPFIIVFFAVCFVAVAIIAKRKWMNMLFLLFVAFGILAMVDFWRWEYNYGHDLDPNAAIKVPGMSYQPPLIGYKQLLNFGAWSVPGIGGWIFVAVGALLMGAVIYEGRRIKKAIIVPVLLVGFLSGCSTGPVPIRFGQDNCDFCKMTISDHRFGAEIVTKKGKVFKFDDAHCVNNFLDDKKTNQQEIAGIYFIDFIEPHQLINANEAYFLQSAKLKSPMNGNVAAFSNDDSLTKVLPQFPGFKITWEDVQK